MTHEPETTELPSCEFDAYHGPERRLEMREWRACVDHRLDKGAELMRELRANLQTNTQLTQDVQANTAELVSLLASFKGAFAVLNMLGKLAKPLGYIVALAGAVWGLWVGIKNGGRPG